MKTDATSALVIGGTGMLADATRWLAARPRSAIVVSRRASLFAVADGNVTAIDADWNQSNFEVSVRRAIKEIAPIGHALLWLHDAEPVLKWLLPLLVDARVAVVLGSRDGHPRMIANAPNVASVRLGCIRTAQGRRWLTHQEIGRATIQALQTGESSMVGATVPINPAQPVRAQTRAPHCESPA